MPSAAALPDQLRAEWCEARPRDFAARFERRARGAGNPPMRLKRRWTLGVTAMAAIALPAFAAPGGWDRFAIADAVAQKAAVEPMPFEQAGASFPGSAFYYLEAEAPVLQVGEGIRFDADDSVSGPAIQGGPAARPLRIDNSGVDRTRALQCLTAAIYYEAASEPDGGQRAVAQVVLNRVAHPAYPKTVCGVVYQGSERSTGCQFSFTCDGSLARRPSRMFWDRAENVARQALAGYVYIPVGLATHYHTVQVNPYWAPSLHYLGTIGAHRFYSFNGQAGRPAAFRFAYFGGEPVAAPHARSQSAVPDAVVDPLAVQRVFDSLEQARMAGKVNAAAAATGTPPLYTSELRERGGDALYRARNLPEAQGIKAEYANTGRWITQPGS
ncbi:Cell Wall Hydrolase [Novosphingobium sp. CF614]|uniref:cell wall hydrolase n=1 Tax=Novosphingobium sp. CF614 TaxID=1884364 RepID=UPI0008EF7A2C|nr:cell wall hydrolase [Novosphingobium sp. CF614]SFG34726.1 Cell Wall Hydrolase [Novosphingobium sp. CF614]